MKVFEAAERPLFSAFLRIVSEPLHVEQRSIAQINRQHFRD